MGVTSFIGLWLGYRTIYKLYPKMKLMLFIPYFLIPTAIIWSSGILKDTIIMGLMGLLLFISSNIFIYKKQFFINILLGIGCIFLLLFLKPILLFVLAPCLILWGVSHSLGRTVTFQKKITLLISALIITISLGYPVSKILLKTSPKYRVENIMKTLKGFQTQHPDYEPAKSQYSLGEISYTPIGIVKKIPQAVNVTFFRPYLWEINSMPTFLTAFESFLTLLFVILLLFTLKKEYLINVVRNIDVIFMMTFSFNYAIITGLSAYNFGALSRFKIPAVFFFILGLIIMLGRNRQFVEERKSN